MVAGLKSIVFIALVAAPVFADDPKPAPAPTPTSTSTSERGTTGGDISAAKEDEEGTPKLSLPTEEDRLAWQKPGFRLGLGLAYGRFDGLLGAPSGRLLGPVLHAGIRLDASWSLMSTFQYAQVKQAGGLDGLRFSGTVDPTWHISPSWSVAIGFGFGGLVEGRTGRVDMTTAIPNESNVSYTFTSAHPALPSCSGVGVSGLARVEWMYVLGPRSATNVSFEVIGQYTACVQNVNTDADTAQAIVYRQYWPNMGGTITWGITWR